MSRAILLLAIFFGARTAFADLVLTKRSPLAVAIHVLDRFPAASLSEIADAADAVIRSTSDFEAKLVPDQVVRECTESGNAVVCIADSVRSGEGRFLLVVSAVDATHVVSLLVEEGRVVAATLPAETHSRADLARHLEEFFATDLAPIFERAGRRRFGEIAIDLPASTTATVSIDGKPLGVANGPIAIRNVPSGRHQIRIEGSGYAPFERVIDVEPRSLAHLSAQLEPAQIEVNRLARTLTFYGGLAAIAAGIAVGVAGLVEPEPWCALDASDCPSTLQRRTLIPVGYSLVGMGAAWTLGSWLGDEDAFPWIELIAGVAIFGVSYGLSWAIDGRCSEGCYDLAGK